MAKTGKTMADRMSEMMGDLTVGDLLEARLQLIRELGQAAGRGMENVDAEWFRDRVEEMAYIDRRIEDLGGIEQATEQAKAFREGRIK